MMDAREIADVARGAGFHDEALTIAVAIALAESGGNPRAHNATAPDDSYGLWQINMYGALGPARRASLGIRTNDALFDPETNARAAFGISGGGTSFTPWSTYTSGAYKSHVEEAAAGTVGTSVAGAGAGGGGGSSWGDSKGGGSSSRVATIVAAALTLFPGGQAAGAAVGLGASAAGAAGSVAGAVGKVLAAPVSVAEAGAKLLGIVLRPDFWTRFGQVLAGVVLVLLALVMLNRDKVAAVAKTAGKAAAL